MEREEAAKIADVIIRPVLGRALELAVVVKMADAIEEVVELITRELMLSRGGERAEDT